MNILDSDNPLSALDAKLAQIQGMLTEVGASLESQTLHLEEVKKDLHELAATEIAEAPAGAQELLEGMINVDNSDASLN